jgi:hypothetical protein
VFDSCIFITKSTPLEELLEAGVALNALAHRANTAEEVPPANELHAILNQVHSAVHNAVH